VRNLLVLSSLLSLSLISCSSVKPIDVNTVQIERTPLNLAAPAAILAKPVNFVIITPENTDKVFSDLKSNKYSLVLFGLTDDSYENLSVNVAELLNYIIEEQNIIKAYKEYYEPQVQQGSPDNKEKK